MAFVEHSYLYHFIRTDHRHNFSVYNTLLHLDSAHGSSSAMKVESLAFLPQLFLSVGLMPVLLAKKDLASTMLAQTFAFVTFNKVCTSQVSLDLMAVLQANADTAKVLSLVHGISALLSAKFEFDKETKTWHRGTCTLGYRAGSLATTRFRTGISWEVDVCSWPVARKYDLFRHQLLDSRHHRR